MKSRPILFNAHMVRALLDGTKTQTRRLLKIQPEGCEWQCGAYSPTVIDKYGDDCAGAEIFGAYTTDGEWSQACPYGQPGDQLWVRETWGVLYEQFINDSHEPTFWRADYSDSDLAEQKAGTLWLPRWRPSIHMFRNRSRITLEITNVRVERLQDISEADAAAEGWMRKSERSNDPEVHQDAARDWYSDLWEQINGAESWKLNPWVWVIEFRKVIA